MLLVGYFEGIGSQRGIAWRCGDSLSLREFLGIPLTEDTPDHSSLTRVRDRLPLEVHTAIFQLVLKLAAEKGLLRGKTVAVDSTTLEANAAMKTIVRRDTGEDWNEYLRRLLQEREGVENPTDEELRRFDRQRKDKRVSNEEWMSPTDQDSRIAKMKDGRTHLAYKAEHVIDLETELVLAVPIYHADAGDADTLVDSVMEAQTEPHRSGHRRGDRRSRRRQGLSRHRHLGTGRLAEHSHVHPRAEAERGTKLAGRAGRETPGGHQQSASHAPRARASDCNACAANGWNAASPMCATRAVRGGVGCVGSRRCKSVT